MAEAAKAQRPEILLVTEAKTVHTRWVDGKFSANSAAWEENKVIPRGRGSRDLRGRRPLVHRQAAGAGRNDRTGHASEGGGSGARG
jgi:hypothetical protein